VVHGVVVSPDKSVRLLHRGRHRDSPALSEIVDLEAKKIVAEVDTPATSRRQLIFWKME